MTKDLNFITSGKAEDAEEKRAGLLGKITQKIQWAYGRTKPFLHDISPGCRTCGSGNWSCLFINGKCNCRCFYCPATQDDISVPTTNRLAFERSADYKDYIRHFGFQGVSISGGEPLLTFDRTLEYIRAVRKHVPDHVHIWMYTNGTLLTGDTAGQLRDAGLNEIRFDIGATHYDLTKLRLAVGCIPVVTVEIPAVPEDHERLADLMPILWDSGVNYLNLHQLRLTPHNSAFLKNRKYTFLHGEKVTVLESELAVLSLFSKAIENNWSLPVNYCSFTYKNQFQRAAARKRSAGFIIKPFESITENGYIRSICFNGDTNSISAAADLLNMNHIPGELYQIGGNKTRITIHESLWPLIDHSRFEIQLNYHESILSPALSYRNAFREIRLDGGMKLYVEKQTRRLALPLAPDQAVEFEKRIILKDSLPDRMPEWEWAENEFIREGLQEYF